MTSGGPRDHDPAGPDPGAGRGRRWRCRGWWLLLAAIAIAAWVHRPSLGLGFVSDDFQWWQAARFALEEPARLVLPYGGFRPANTWLLALEHLLYGTEPFGYHVTSLLLHLGCGLALWFLLGRLCLSASARALVSLLWLCSPYTLEPAQSVCVRFQPLLMLGWTGMALVWPRAGEPWTGRRLATAVGLTLLTLASKESWVVLPAFVAVFEVALRHQSLWTSLRRAALVSLAPLVYVAVYLIDPPITTSYFGSLSQGLVKVPHAWAVFSGLTSLRPVDLRLGTPEVLALVTMAALTWLGWRWRRPAVAVGLALFLLPFLPIAAVGFMATRYTAIPLAGFLIAVADLVRAAGERLGGRSRWPLRAATTAVCGVYFLAHLAWLSADMEDAHARDAAHRRLVEEAEALAPALPADGVVLAVRVEHDNQILDLALGVRGVPKIYFPRHGDPYGLVDWAALLSWVSDAAGGGLWERLDGPAIDRAAGQPYLQVLHVRGGFSTAPGSDLDLPSAARSWEERGFPVTVLRPWRSRQPGTGEPAPPGPVPTP